MITNNPREGEDIANVDGDRAKLTLNFYRFLDDLTDLTNNLESRIVVLESKIDALEFETFADVTASMTTTGSNQNIICTNTVPITITLGGSPAVNRLVNIKRRGAQVTVVGSIDGSTPTVINVVNFSIKLLYTGTEYVQI